MIKDDWRNRMEKEEAVKLLISNGYDAVLDKGVPMVLIDKRNDSIYDVVSKLLTEKGYNSSYGVRCTNSSIYKIKEETITEIEGAL